MAVRILKEREPLLKAHFKEYVDDELDEFDPESIPPRPNNPAALGLPTPAAGVDNHPEESNAAQAAPVDHQDPFEDDGEDDLDDHFSAQHAFLDMLEEHDRSIGDLSPQENDEPGVHPLSQEVFEVRRQLAQASQEHPQLSESRNTRIGQDLAAQEEILGQVNEGNHDSQQSAAVDGVPPLTVRQLADRLRVSMDSPAHFTEVRWKRRIMQFARRGLNANAAPWFPSKSLPAPRPRPLPHPVAAGADSGDSNGSHAAHADDNSIPVPQPAKRSDIPLQTLRLDGPARVLCHQHVPPPGRDHRDGRPRVRAWRCRRSRT